MPEKEKKEYPPEMIKRYRELSPEEHKLASFFMQGGDPAKHYALSNLNTIARQRAFLTRSPINVALLALNSSNIAIQTEAAILLLRVSDQRTATAIRWRLQDKPHGMVASFLKEALAKINRKQARKRKQSDAA